MDCVAWLGRKPNLLFKHAFVVSRQKVPHELPGRCIGIVPRKRRGRRKAGCPEYPQPVCAKNAHGSHHEYTGNHPAFPAQWF